MNLGGPKKPRLIFSPLEPGGVLASEETCLRKNNKKTKDKERSTRTGSENAIKDVFMICDKVKNIHI